MAVILLSRWQPMNKNAAKVEGEEFMVQLSSDESAAPSRCKNFTLKSSTGLDSNIKYVFYFNYYLRGLLVLNFGKVFCGVLYDILP